jgi:hypothetical protein
MQKIAVEILAKGYTGLTAENIEKALSYYFGSPSLGVSFSVTEADQHSVQRTACTHGVGEWVEPFKFHCTICDETISRR